MSIRQGLLALLERGPMHGYQLKTEFESTTGAVWALNIGQVYSTLARLERDGLVSPLEPGADGQQPYEITAGGRRELRDWYATPVERQLPRRDELTVKIMLAVSAPAIDVHSVIQAQRRATMTTLQQYTRLKADARPGQDLAWLLVVDQIILQAEAEVRWLDLCDARVRGARPAPARSTPARSEVARSEADVRSDTKARR